MNFLLEDYTSKYQYNGYQLTRLTMWILLLIISELPEKAAETKQFEYSSIDKAFNKQAKII